MSTGNYYRPDLHDPNKRYLSALAQASSDGLPIRLLDADFNDHFAATLEQIQGLGLYGSDGVDGAESLKLLAPDLARDFQIQAGRFMVGGLQGVIPELVRYTCVTEMVAFDTVQADYIHHRWTSLATNQLVDTHTKWNAGALVGLQAVVNGVAYNITGNSETVLTLESFTPPSSPAHNFYYVKLKAPISVAKLTCDVLLDVHLEDWGAAEDPDLNHNLRTPARIVEGMRRQKLIQRIVVDQYEGETSQLNTVLANGRLGYTDLTGTQHYVLKLGTITFARDGDDEFFNVVVTASNEREEYPFSSREVVEARAFGGCVDQEPVSLAERFRRESGWVTVSMDSDEGMYIGSAGLKAALQCDDVSFILLKPGAYLIDEDITVGARKTLLGAPSAGLTSTVMIAGAGRLVFTATQPCTVEAIDFWHGVPDDIFTANSEAILLREATTFRNCNFSCNLSGANAQYPFIRFGSNTETDGHTAGNTLFDHCKFAKTDANGELIWGNQRALEGATAPAIKTPVRFQDCYFAGYGPIRVASGAWEFHHCTFNGSKLSAGPTLKETLAHVVEDWDQVRLVNCSSYGDTRLSVWALPLVVEGCSFHSAVLPFLQYGAGELSVSATRVQMQSSATRAISGHSTGSIRLLDTRFEHVSDSTYSSTNNALLVLPGRTQARGCEFSHGGTGEVQVPVASVSASGTAEFVDCKFTSWPNMAITNAGTAVATRCLFDDCGVNNTAGGEPVILVDVDNQDCTVLFDERDIDSATDGVWGFCSFSKSGFSRGLKVRGSLPRALRCLLLLTGKTSALQVSDWDVEVTAGSGDIQSGHHVFAIRGGSLRLADVKVAATGDPGVDACFASMLNYKANIGAVDLERLVLLGVGLGYVAGVSCAMRDCTLTSKAGSEQVDVTGAAELLGCRFADYGIELLADTVTIQGGVFENPASVGQVLVVQANQVYLQGCKLASVASSSAIYLQPLSSSLKTSVLDCDIESLIANYTGLTEPVLKIRAPADLSDCTIRGCRIDGGVDVLPLGSGVIPAESRLAISGNTFVRRGLHVATPHNGVIQGNRVTDVYCTLGVPSSRYSGIVCGPYDTLSASCYLMDTQPSSHELQILDNSVELLPNATDADTLLGYDPEDGLSTGSTNYRRTGIQVFGAALVRGNTIANAKVAILSGLINGAARTQANGVHTEIANNRIKNGVVALAVGTTNRVSLLSNHWETTDAHERTAAMVAMAAPSAGATLELFGNVHTGPARLDGDGDPAGWPTSQPRLYIADINFSSADNLTVQYSKPQGYWSGETWVSAANLAWPLHNKGLTLAKEAVFMTSNLLLETTAKMKYNED